jgi:death on curing protein
VIYLTAEDVAGINADLAGPGGIRDAGLVESACARPQATAFGEDAYPSTWEKAAALLQSLACNHAFTDGNKRTAWMATAVFLGVNGHPLDDPLDEDAAEELMLAVATGAVRDVPVIAGALVKFFRA